MNNIVSIFGVILILAGIVLVALQRRRGKAASMKTLIIVGAVLWIGAKCFTIVPTGYTGVRETFGQISTTPVMTGFNWKIPFVQDIRLVNTKQTDKLIATQIWGESSEKTPVYASDIVVSYQINAAKAAWICAAIDNDPSFLLNDTLVSSAIKAAMVELKTEEVTVRTSIERLSQEKLADAINEKYGSDVLRIAKVTINQMDFEESYNAAISAKSIARQTQERQAIENQTAIDKADADKKVSITSAEAAAEAAKIQANADAEVAKIKAQADAEVAKIKAQAEAEVITTKADAQAAANGKLAKSLTEEVLKQQFYENWDGKLPTVMGEGTVITDIGN